MSEQKQYKPRACANNCGKDIVFEMQPTGKWLPFEFDVENWVKLERHMCPNYKPQQQQNKPFENRGQGTNWAGTNKQGQFVEARESNTQQGRITREQMILEKLNDHTKLLTQILLLLKTPFIEEPKRDKEKEQNEKIGETRIEDKQQQEDVYGF